MQKSRISLSTRILMVVSLAWLLLAAGSALAQQDKFVYLPVILSVKPIPSPEEYLGQKLPVQEADRFFEDSVLNSTGQLAIWVPPNVETVRGVFFQNGSPVRPNSKDPDWRNEVAQDREWAARQLAWMWGFAYISGTVWHDDRRGFDEQEQFFHEAIEEFAQSTGHSELRNAPLVIKGESRTGAFGARYGEKHPGRVIAYVIIVIGHPTVAPGVPGLMVVGERDRGQEIVNDSFMRDRGQGALLSIAMIWGEGHICNRCGDLAWPFMDQMVRERVPEDADPTQGPVTLKPLVESEGWLGDVDNWGAVYPYDQYPGDKSRAAWFPNAYMAQLWRNFVQQDPALTMTSPTRPYKWADGFTQDPAPIFEGEMRDWRAGTPLTLQAKVNRAVNGEIRFYDGDEELGVGVVSADGKTVALNDVTLSAGMHTFILKEGDQPLSWPAGLILLE